ncbi:MAG: hypothetical protein NT018_07845 [Armatimonadetes bacterium]|nr:hypothetical protein [Armatimonadota bacterium]
MTNNRRICFLTIALSLMISVAGFAAEVSKAPGMSYLDVNKILQVSQLKRGMKGYALTVFQGTKIEKFSIEILGVLKKANSGRDLILVRIGGGPMATRGLGVASGMSGSPVYIDGKLVGAISMAMTFSKEPIGMVTPITDMVESLDDSLPKHADGYSSINELDEPAVVGGRTFSKIVIDGPANKSDKPGEGELHVTPLAMPIMVTGVSQRGIASLKEMLAPYNLEVMAGIGGGADTTSKFNPKLEPGAAVGVSLVTGDIDMTATGTVTYCTGNKLVAFGHPFFQGIGPIDAPMTTAYISDVMASYNSSTKLGFPLKVVGRVFQDRPWSIAGAVGDFPNLIPITVSVKDQTIKRNKIFNAKVINHPLLAGQLATIAVGEAISQVHTGAGDATAEVSYEIIADRIGTIKRSNIFFDPTSIESSSVKDVASMLQLLGNNPFFPLDIKSVKVDVVITDKRKTATVDRIFVKKSEYAPGETVEVGVVLRPYKKERITKTYSIKIPATAQNGKVTLSVRGGGTQLSLLSMISAISGGEGAISGDSGANADNVKQLVDKYLEKECNNQVVVQLIMPSTTVNVAGETLTGMPSSIADVMKTSRSSGLKMERDEVKALFDEDMIVAGSAKLIIDVKQKSFNENKTGSTAPKSAPGTPGLVFSADDSVDTSFVIQNDDNYTTENMDADPSDPLPVIDPAADAKPVTVPEPVKDEEAAKTEDKKPSPPTPAAKSDVKTVVRQAQTWSQRSQADFAKGTFSGVAASSENKLELTPTLKKLAETPEQFVWCVAPAKGGILAGTGNSGKIYFVADNGDVKLFCETGALEVHAMAHDSKGNLYAATSPDGKVFKITPDGKSSLLFKTEERFVVALTADGKDNIYAGVGDAGKIYRITPDGAGSVFASINEQQILSLKWDANGYLLAGTGINGVVYKISADGAAQPVFDAPESAISSITSDSKGNIYAGTSPKGVVYKISPDGGSKPVYTGTAKVLSMAADPSDNIYAVSDGSLVKISPDETIVQLDSAKDTAQFLALAFNSSNNTLYAGAGNIGSIYVSKVSDTAGTYESPVHDTKMISKWGRIKWAAEAPKGTLVELQTRCGNVDTPDNTWSGWSKLYTKGSGEQITGKDARYIQYRVALKTSKSQVSPTVSGVTISYLTPNQQPKISLTEPVGGSTLSGSKSIKWTGSDPDKDTLTYDVFYSKDGKAWTALMGGATSVSEEKNMTTEEIAGKVKSELEKSTDVPDDMKKIILEGQEGAVAAAHATTNAAAGQSSTSSTYNWDTTKLPDGAYCIKVVASDKTSNATGALTEKAESDPIIVCNTPPELIILAKKSIEVKGTGLANIGGNASSKLVDIAGVQYRIDGGDWMAAAPEDGVFDSPSESFTVTTSVLTPGSHKLEVQAIDAAGNTAIETVEVKVV